MSFLYSAMEIRRRREHAQELMRAQSLDALLLTNDENLIYFVGLPTAYGLHHSNDRPGIAILPSEGDPICVVAANMASIIRPVVRSVNIREYTSISGVPPELAIAALNDAGLKNKCMGIEAGLSQRIGMPYTEYTRLLQSFPEVRFIDAAPLIWKMRMVKSDEEIAQMKNAAEITGKARQRCFDQVVPGMTYREIARLLSRYMLEEGADGVSFIMVQSSPQDRMNPVQPRYMNMFPETLVKKGEALNIDAGAYVYPYTIDFNRWATLGKPTTRFKKYHRIVTEVSRRMAEAIRPGATCRDIFGVATNELSKHGLYQDYQPSGRMGHGMGLLITEPPSVNSTDNTMLEPGLVFSTEPQAFGEGVRMVYEDVWVVRDDGAELLTTESSEIREIAP